MVADSSYGGQSVLCFLPTNCDLTSRLVKDLAVVQVAPERQAGTGGFGIIGSLVSDFRHASGQAFSMVVAAAVTLDIYWRSVARTLKWPV